MLKKLILSVSFISLMSISPIMAQGEMKSPPEKSIPSTGVKIEKDALDLEKEQMIDPLVQIYTSQGTCSGTIVFSGVLPSTTDGSITTIILTAKHCSAKYGEGELVQVQKANYGDNMELLGETNYYGNIVVKSQNSDLASIVLKDRKTVFPVAEVASSDIKLKFGQKVWAAGYPIGRSVTITEGTLGMKEYLTDLPPLPTGEQMTTSGEFQRSSAAIQHGSSGGPLFTKDEKGNFVVIGVASLMLGTINFMAYYTPLDQIIDFK